MYEVAPCCNTKSTRKFLECNGIPILKWQGSSPETNSIENVLNIMKKEICNQISPLHEEMWKRVFEVCYSVALNALDDFNNSTPRRIADLIKQREVQRILIL